MDEEIERLVIGVRADTQGFARDVETMRSGLEGPLAAGADRAGRAIERGLLRAVRTGKFGFEDLALVAPPVLDGSAASALRSGLGTLGGGGSGGGAGGLLGIGTSLLGAALGLPGRAGGGPVAPGRGYIVGERGPEVFVPTSSGHVVPSGRGGGRDVRVAITVNAGGGDAPQVLARSARQVARAVRGALEG
jgi:hypothetical protein